MTVALCADSELVSRLENMKRHVQGNGSSSCLLCGHRFGVLVTSARVRCRDCKKVGLPPPPPIHRPHRRNAPT